ncbi:hypothetical protein L9F63_021464, partial [Diploptera punctata]
MPSLTGDERKDFIIITATNYFGLGASEEICSQLSDDVNLNTFLDDASCFTLCNLEFPNQAAVKMSLETYAITKIVPREGKEKQLVFFKIKPEVITPDNLHENVFVSSMVDSPVSTLYHALQKVFAPVLLKDDKWSYSIDPKLQELVIQLESGLRSVLQKSDPTVQDNSELTGSLIEIMSPEDEMQFLVKYSKLCWTKDEKEKGAAFWYALEPLVKDFRSLDSLFLADVDEIVETAHNTLDDLWKLDDFTYPQHRMEHLMDVIGNTLTRFIQNKLKSVNIWEETFAHVEANLSQAIHICEKWKITCERLTSLFWPNYSSHPWKGKPFIPNHIRDFSSRLQEVLDLRTLHRQLTRLLSQKEQEELKTSETFKPFSGLNPIQFNPYTEPLWRAAVKQFEHSLIPTEERVAGKLQSQLRNVNANTLQLLQEFKRYQELIQRPSVGTKLIPERENLLGLLREYIHNVSSNFTSGQNRQYAKMLDMPEIISNIYWVRQLEYRVNDIEKTSAKLLNELQGYSELQRAVSEVLRDLKEHHSEQFDGWTRDMSTVVFSTSPHLRTDEPVVKYDQGKLMHVNYNPKLVGLVKEVRQLSVLGYKIPMKIQEAAELAKRFMKQAKALEQIANFHNTIGDRMIASQRPMMLEAALDFNRLVQEQNGVTWSDTVAVDKYIARLQISVERLSRENNKLAAYHAQIRDKVITLMNTDLLRHQQQWKEGLKDIRDIMTQVEEQKFTNMKSWRAHWDRQLYKALEHQYQVGLEALNEHLPEIKVELMYRQQKLQFRPPMEEIRMKYYGQLKRFLAIPNNFRGVTENNESLIFPVIIDRFGYLFAKAEDLFGRLDAVKDRWLQWVALGSVDLDQLAEQYLKTAEDWDRNFRASKTWSQEIAKLPSADEKIDCFSVSFLPVRAEIELHNRRYWDTLVSSLQTSIVRDIGVIEKFCTESTDLLSRQPQTVEEIGEANTKHTEIMKSTPEMLTIFEEAEKKNKTLASWTKERVEQVGRMGVIWDNFQSMLDNHQYFLSKQLTDLILAKVDGILW